MTKGIPVARVVRPDGRDGSVALSLYDSFPIPPDTEEPLLVEIDSLTVPLYLNAFTPRGRAGAVVRFDDLDTPARVEPILGHELFLDVPAASREPLIEELEGFAVEARSADGRPLGRGVVVAIYPHPLNPLLGVRMEGRAGDALIPLADELVEAVDEEARTLRLVLPEGLLDLNP